MTIHLELVTAPYLAPLQAFVTQYGLMVLGALLLLGAFSGRRIGPLALITLVLGLGLVVAGAAHLFVPLVGR
ncbi:MAG: hypothetical protein HYY50_01630 [Candidatus Kerfeldbacteria bacterium]|nr:hypothetical protein [Candidatus Kerfeldbacteria bacterium]